MNNNVCMPMFYFTLLIVVCIISLLWGTYYFIVNRDEILAKLGLNKISSHSNNNNNNNNNQPRINDPMVIIEPPRLSPDQVDDLAHGELPPRRSDYRKLEDPFKEPSRRYVTYPGGSVPWGNVNIPTQGYLPAYQLMGYLRKKEGDDPERMLKLFGRRIDTNRYEYYTLNHDDQTLKIPLNVRGDRELYDKDDLHVPGYPGSYKVELYNYDSPRYIPYLL